MDIASKKSNSSTNRFLLRPKIMQKPLMTSKHEAAPPMGLFKHKAYLSCLCSPQQNPLRVCQEQLRLKFPQKKGFMLRQQCNHSKKTEHINFQYIRLLKERKEIINWIKYNIFVGIHYFIGKAKQSLLWLDKKYISQELKENHHSSKIFLEITELEHILNQHIERQNAKNPNFQRYSQDIDCNPSENKKKYHFQQELPPHSKKLHRNYPYRIRVSMDQQLKLQQDTSFDELKQKIYKFKSTVCSLYRTIRLRKENQFVYQVSAKAKRSSCMTATELEQVLRISEERTEIINELADKLLYFHKNQKHLVLNKGIIKDIAGIDLSQVEKRTAHSKEPAKRQQKMRNQVLKINNIIINLQEQRIIPKNSVGQAEHQKQGEERQSKLRFQIKRHRQAVQKGKSIHQLRIRTLEQSNRTAESGQSRQSNKIINKRKTSKFKSVETQENEKIEKKDSRFRKTNFRRKGITFSREDSNQDGEESIKLTKKSIKASTMKSIKASTIKSLKTHPELTWKMIEAESSKNSISLRSMKSFKSLKSQKRIGQSQHSIKSGKYLRSMKTIWETKGYKGKKYISCARIFRNKLKMSLNEQQSCQNIKITTGKDCQIKSDSDVEPSNSEKNLSNTSVLEYAQHETLERNNVIEICTRSPIDKEISKPNLRSAVCFKSTLRIKQKEQPQQQGVLDELIKKLRQIGNERSLKRQKEIILEQIEKVYLSGQISEQEYLKFKSLFQVKINQRIRAIPSTLPTEPEEEISSSFHSQRNKMKQVRKMMAQTTDPCMINKFYFKVGQFEEEEKWDEDNKQELLLREEQMFAIRTSTFRRARPQIIEMYKQIPLKHQGALTQKALS